MADTTVDVTLSVTDFPTATTTTPGIMSAEDKAFLDALVAAAGLNTQAE